jgi:membrane-associated phospholipid phosphatase
MLSNIDTYLFNVINHGLANGLFDSFMPFFTDNSYYLLIPFVIWIFIKDPKKALLATVLSILSLMFSDWAVHLLKEGIERPRPFVVLDDARVLVGRGKAFSMPSGHAASAFSVVLPIIILFGGFVRPVLMFGAISVAISRIYVGVHYPSDVLAGAIVGVVTAIFAMYLYKWSFRNYKEDKLFKVLLLIIGVISLFRIYHILTGPFELGPGEAYYWDLSRRLGQGDYSHGPLTGYLISVSRLIFSDTVFGIRIVAVIVAALSSVMLFYLVKSMYDEKTAVLSTVLYQFIPMLSLLGVVSSATSVFIVFWIVSMYLVWIITVKVERGEKTKWFWMLLGLPMGMGLLAGCEMMVFFVCLLLYMLSDEKLKEYYVRPYPYIGLMVSLIVCSPVIIWNAGHNWISLEVLLQDNVLDLGVTVSSMKVIRSLGLQFVMVSPVLFVLIWRSVLKMMDDTKGKFLFWFSAPPFFLYLATSALLREEMIWAVVPYIAGLIAFSFLYLKGFKLLSRGWKFTVIAGLSLAVVFSVLAHYPQVLRLPPDKDPSVRFIGWEGLGIRVSKIADNMQGKGDYFIASDDCNVSGELAFYVDGKPVTYCANTDSNVSQFGPRLGYADMVNYNAIFVMIKGSEMSGRLSNAFERCETHIHIAKMRGKEVRHSKIYECYDFKGVKEIAL